MVVIHYDSLRFEIFSIDKYMQFHNCCKGIFKLENPDADYMIDVVWENDNETVVYGLNRNGKGLRGFEKLQCTVEFVCPD